MRCEPSLGRCRTGHGWLQISEWWHARLVGGGRHWREWRELRKPVDAVGSVFWNRPDGEFCPSSVWRESDITRRPGRRMAEWPLLDMDLPESVQVAGCLQKKDKHGPTGRHHLPCLLSEPEKSASRTTSIPHLFAYPFENSFSLDHPLAPPVTSS